MNGLVEHIANIYPLTSLFCFQSKYNRIIGDQLARLWLHIQGCQLIMGLRCQMTTRPVANNCTSPAYCLVIYLSLEDCVAVQRSFDFPTNVWDRNIIQLLDCLTNNIMCPIQCWLYHFSFINNLIYSYHYHTCCFTSEKIQCYNHLTRAFLQQDKILYAWLIYT